MRSLEELESVGDIAVIGMAGRFPGADNLDQFWQNLREGKETIAFFVDEELVACGIEPATLKDPSYVKAKGILNNPEGFDAHFFDYTPREAEVMDPQHRLFLECAWEALENAGYNSQKYEGLIGAYGGSRMNTYAFGVFSAFNRLELLDDVPFLIGNDKDYLTTRVSHKLNLRGASINVQSACSTSLVAVCLGVQSLLNYQNDIVLAGGVRVSVPRKNGYMYQEEGILSPDGHCRAFDANGQGTVFGDGVGVVVLKRLEDALNEGDTIHAVIKGSAINNDGATKTTFTAPGVNGQIEVISTAIAASGVDVETITYIECHGTGTRLGDPIEIAALKQAFGCAIRKKNFCAIGSVKPNIGHLSAASGVASLIKTILALKHKIIPPSINFEQLNPQIDLENSPFYINKTLSPWEPVDIPRRAGVSSFGLGGTNAHVILEEAPQPTLPQPSRSYSILTLSAKTDSALETATANLVDYFKRKPDLNLADAAYTLQVGRCAFEQRRMVICSNLEEAITALETHNPSCAFTGQASRTDNSPVVFMFPGQGAQYVNMASDLYRLEPTFKEEIDRCSNILKPLLSVDIRDLLSPREVELEQAACQLEQTYFTQPVLFAVEYALAKLLMEWGVCPQMMIGHSIGEYVAACLANVFSLEDALSLVAYRGQLMQQMPEGAMLAVQLPEEEVKPFLTNGICLAAVNGSAICVLSGPTDAVEALQSRLTEQDVPYRRLHTSRAFHSQMIEPIMAQFAERVEKIKLNPPKIYFVSNETGSWITEEEATDPSYWVRHMRQTVRFSDGLEELLKEPDRILLEVGPGRTLSGLVRRSPSLTNSELVLSSLPHPGESVCAHKFLLNAIGRLWVSGVEINWSRFYARERRCRIPLPTYPFEHQNYWIELRPLSAVSNKPESPTSSSGGKRPDLANWFYVPSWEFSSLVPAETKIQKTSNCWLVFTDNCGLGAQLVERLKERGQSVIQVRVGSEFARLSEATYSLDPQQSQHYHVLLEELRTQSKTPGTILHFWNVIDRDQALASQEALEESQKYGFYSLLYLAQALGSRDIVGSIEIAVISNNMQDVTGEEQLHPEKATLLGPIKVIPQEYPAITCRSIDVVLPASGSLQERTLVDLLLTEFLTQSSDSIVAFRQNQRWRQKFEPIRLENSPQEETLLREGGVYLITGGLGGIGFTLAEYLAKTTRGRLILTGRSPIPEREQWEQWLQTHSDEDNISRKLTKIKELESWGAQVLPLAADVSDQQQMQRLVTKAEEKFGPINGVIHSAGVPAGSLIANKSAEEAERILAPKVKGTLILDSLFKNTQLDFLLLCSSQTAVLGRFGQVDYCAANAFMDAFAHRKASKNGNRTVSVNWDVWDGVGMAVNTQVPMELREWRTESLQHGILPEEGMAVFERLLGATLPQIIVSTRNFLVVKKEHNVSEVDRFRHALEKVNLSKPNQSRFKRKGAYVAPRNELERSIAEIWQDILGIEEIGIHDNFLELGGQSLIATMLISRLRKTAGLELSLRSFLESPTIAGLSEAAQKSDTMTSQKPPATISPVSRERYRAKSTSGESLPSIQVGLEQNCHNGKQEKTVSRHNDQEDSRKKHKEIAFSLFFFSAHEASSGKDKYKLLLESAKFADRNGFEAIWTPERHFNGFGGLYASPSLTSAALAMITNRIKLRAGSVILPLHNPIRVAEEWSIIDNLSQGRVAIAFGSGWHINDFVLSPQAYPKRKNIMFEGIEMICKLWRGEQLSMANGAGKSTKTAIFPRPFQPELPIWLTAESPETFVMAGQIGANVLTALLHQEIDDAVQNIALYRKTLAEHGYDPESRQVTMMQHTFIGEDCETVKAKAGAAYYEYVRTNLGLQVSNAVGLGMDTNAKEYNESDILDIASNAFERHSNTTGLIGTQESCLEKVNRLKTIGVDEIACLIDFMPNFDSVMTGLNHLNELKRLSNGENEPESVYHK